MFYAGQNSEFGNDNNQQTIEEYDIFYDDLQSSLNSTFLWSLVQCEYIISLLPCVVVFIIRMFIPG